MGGGFVSGRRAANLVGMGLDKAYECLVRLILTRPCLPCWTGQTGGWAATVVA